jgi:hypothetical protein
MEMTDVYERDEHIDSFTVLTLSVLPRSAFVTGLVLCIIGGTILAYTYRDTLGLATPMTAEQAENLRAFAKLYGYVRYFHPSDVAAETDWEKFAMHGVRKVKDASNQAELRADLEALFEPIAPTVQLYRTGSEPPPPTDVLAPSDTAGLRPVAWQHKGLGLHSSGHPYRSLRTNRADSLFFDDTERRKDEDWLSASIVQRPDFTPLQGQQVRLQMDVRTAPESRVHLFLLLLHGNSRNEPLSDPISSNSWSTHERTVNIPRSVNHLAVGALVRDPGTAWIDDIELLTRETPNDAWRRVELHNASFEVEGRDRSLPGWEVHDYPGNRASAVAEDAAEGKRSLRLSFPRQSNLRLFDERPRPGETVEKPIGRGLSAQVPLVLYSRDGQTLRPDGAPPTEPMQARLDSLDLPQSGTAFFAANVVVAWNVFQHFYPYFDVVEVNWNEVLGRSLRRALADRSEDEFRRTLQRLVAQLQDGHGRVSPSPVLNTEWPFALERAEGEVIVADTASPPGTESNLCPEPGDLVVSVNGTPVEDKLRYAKRHVSGSPQYKNWIALRTLAEYVDEDPSRFILRREGERVQCQVRRYTNVPTQRLRKQTRPAPFDTLEAGTYYVDLTRLPWLQVRERLVVLSRAQNVIFDVRGYPQTGNLRIVQYLSRDTLRSVRLQTPQLIYPNRERLAGYEGSGGTYLPEEPQINGEVAFLTNAGAISYAEALMGVVEHYDLGTIVGQPTAGANGNINRTDLLDDYSVRWTGMRVRKPDGAQHHLVGIRPDIEVERTVEGLRSKRDEMLQRALDVLRESPSATVQ